jgi:hypothetical protein
MQAQKAQSKCIARVSRNSSHSHANSLITKASMTTRLYLLQTHVHSEAVALASIDSLYLADL